MKIIENTIERLAWYLVILVFLGGIIVLIIVTNILKDIRNQQQYFHTTTAQSQQIIEQNQVAQTVAIKDYIACLLTLNPQSSLTAQEQVCFNKSPNLKN